MTKATTAEKNDKFMCKNKLYCAIYIIIIIIITYGAYVCVCLCVAYYYIWNDMYVNKDK